jgi:tetratricopeptide (TPR) repeat protein
VANESPSERADPKPIISRDAGWAALVVCATLAAYFPALGGAFLWNDGDYVTAPALRSLGGLARIWKEVGATQQYYPLLHSFFWVQHLLWGDRPLGYHAVTILLHAGSAVLFALVLRRLLSGSQARPPAGTEWLAALLFALHPVHVESVAWISEQKNTTSLALYLASALLYLRFDETRRPRTYAAALALFACALACKTVTASLPAALLVAFWWKRGRLDWRRDVVPLLPWLALGAAAGLFSGWVERKYVGAQGGEFDLAGAARTLVAGRAVWFYAGKLAWPFGLNFIYPRWTVDATAWWQWLFPLGVLAVAAALWSMRRRSRGPLAAFLFFTGSLFPVLGFFNLYGDRYSWVWDHWQYLPDLGPVALAAVGLAAGWTRAAPHLGRLGAGLAAALLVLLGSLSWAHCGMFHDDETLYRETLDRNPASWLAHNNLGTLLSGRPGGSKEAVAQFEEAIRLRPDYAMTHYNLGNALARVPGRTGDAIAQLEEAIRLNPDYAEAHINLGAILARIPGRLDEAIAHYNEALRIDPASADARNNLGSAFAMMPGRMDDAIAQFREALRLQPGYAEAHLNLGIALSRRAGRLDEAIAQYQEALRLDPDHAETHFNLGNALREAPGRLDDAIAQYDEAIRLNPDYAEAHTNLGTLLAHMPGRLDDAIAEYHEALRLRPESAFVHLDLAIALLQVPGRNAEAQEQLAAALRIQPGMEAARRLLEQARASQR